MITLQDIKQEFSKFIYLLDDHIIDVTMAVIVANRMAGDSLSMYIVGPSSSAKTEVIRSLILYPHACHITKITQNTLMSGYKEPGRKGENYSLLLELKKSGQNILVFKDFTTILSMHRDARQELMSQIRELADGYVCNYYGNRQVIKFQGNIGIIAACTNALDEYTTVTEQLGERFLKYRVTAEMGEDIVKKAMDSATEKEVARTTTSELVRDFLARFDILPDLPRWEDGNIKYKVESLCILAAHIRSQVIMDRMANVMHTPPVHEGPGRLGAAAQKLSYALAIVQEKTTIDHGVYIILKKVIKDTVPQYRLKILEKLYEYKKLTTAELSRKVNFSYPSAKRYCEDLYVLEIITKKDYPGIKEHFWEILPEYISYIEKSEIFILDKF